MNVVRQAPNGHQHPFIGRQHLLGTTYLTGNPIDLNKRMTETLILTSKDPLRWLYYKETGQDPGPVQHPDFRAFLQKRYHTKMWGEGNDKLYRMLDAIEDPEERKKVQKELVEVLKNIKPFLDYWRQDQALQKQFRRK